MVNPLECHKFVCDLLMAITASKKMC